jgi:hypothetical protein
MTKQDFFSIINFIRFGEIIIVDKIGEIIGNKYKF